jgi:hypothetical protein
MNAGQNINNGSNNISIIKSIILVIVNRPNIFYLNVVFLKPKPIWLFA